MPVDQSFSQSATLTSERHGSSMGLYLLLFLVLLGSEQAEVRAEEEERPSNVREGAAYRESSRHPYPYPYF